MKTTDTAESQFEALHTEAFELTETIQRKLFDAFPHPEAATWTDVATVAVVRNRIKAIVAFMDGKDS